MKCRHLPAVGFSLSVQEDVFSSASRTSVNWRANGDRDEGPAKKEDAASAAGGHRVNLDQKTDNFHTEYRSAAHAQIMPYGEG